jgi:hypothetical protein
LSREWASRAGAISSHFDPRLEENFDGLDDFAAMAVQRIANIKREATETFGENVVATEIRIK